MCEVFSVLLILEWTAVALTCKSLGFQGGCVQKPISTSLFFFFPIMSSVELCCPYTFSHACHAHALGLPGRAQPASHLFPQEVSDHPDHIHGSARRNTGFSSLPVVVRAFGKSGATQRPFCHSVCHSKSWVCSHCSEEFRVLGRRSATKTIAESWKALVNYQRNTSNTER